MRKFLLIAALFASPAFAADMIPLKAPPKLSLAYPSTQGFYFGVGTMGGGGKVSGDVPGVNSNSLISNEIGAAFILGYVWNVPNSAYFAAAEGWFGVTNFNGSAPGFSFGGPATFTQRVMVGAPLNDIAALFPTWNLQVPPFPTLPGGQTASNIKPYLFASLTEDDKTLDILGVGSNKVWGFAPGMGIGMKGQLTSGSVVDVFAMTRFPQKGFCVGNGLNGQACGSIGTTYIAGLALDW